MNIMIKAIYLDMFSFTIELILLSVAAVAAAAAAITNDIPPYSVNTFKNLNYVRGHDVMVHLLEWKWMDIADECERFLGPVGYGGIQVSPIQENVIIPMRPWWERYQPVSYRWITRSGNEIEFREMVKRCNRAGVRIYVDVILNHMSADHTFETIGTGNSTADPPSRNYSSVPYNMTHFNDWCNIIDYNNAIQVRNCELVGLHDLDQSNEYVRQKIIDFMNDAIDVGVAGFRIDAAKHMWPSDLNLIYSRLNNLNVNHGFNIGARPYIYQEVIDMGGEGISNTEYNIYAAVTEFRYGIEVSNGIRGINPLKWFKNIGEKWGMLSHNDSLVFIDNHDNQRGHGGGGSVLTYKQSKYYKMAIAFMLAHPYGNPQIISSFAFNDKDQGPPSDIHGNLISPIGKEVELCEKGWICEHRWRQIYNMVRFRNVVNDTEISEWWDNGNNQIAFSRGNNGFIAINAQNIDLKRLIHTQLPSGIYCDIISGIFIRDYCTGKTIVIDEDGYGFIEILSNDDDGVIAIDVNAKL